MDPRQIVIEREMSCCLRCGKLQRAGSFSSLHHRQSRRVGPDSVPNLVLLCGSGSNGCHGYVHTHPAEAQAEGYIVSVHLRPELIEQVPVRSAFWQSFILLNPDGTVTLWGN